MQARRFVGRVALVTGASGGIGGAVARRLADEGAAVAVHYHRSQAPAEKLVSEITHACGQAFSVGGDAADAVQCEAMIAAVVARFGFIDILVNAAGALENLPFGSVTAEAFDRQFHANTLSAVLMMQAAVPHFPAGGGAVINLSTNIAASPLPGTAIYSASKAALNAITAGFAKELGPRGITVNAVSPGATDTAMLAWLDDATKQGIARATPLGRIGQPDDVAGAVAFFASDAAKFITGRSLIIDGGLV